MKKFDHISTIHKSLTGEITAAEKQLLEDWLNADSRNEAIAEQVKLIWSTTASCKQEQRIDVDGGLSRFREARITSATTSAVNEAVAENIKAFSVRRFLLRAAVAAGFFFGLFFLFSEMGQNGFNGYTEIITNSGQQESVTLEDGSKVYINGRSDFDYPLKFENTARKVLLAGEAFFEISKDSQRPFSITTSDLEIKILGTSFNVFAYPDKATEEVVVASGEVLVRLKQNTEKYVLNAGDHLTYNRKNNEVSISKDIQQNAQAWRTGTLTFDHIPLVEVCQVLEKHFDIEIQLDNKAIAKCPFTAKAFKNAQKEIVLETLGLAFGLEVEKTGKATYKLTGGSCN